MPEFYENDALYDNVSLHDVINDVHKNNYDELRNAISRLLMGLSNMEVYHRATTVDTVSEVALNGNLGHSVDVTFVEDSSSILIVLSPGQFISGSLVIKQVGHLDFQPNEVLELIPASNVMHSTLTELIDEVTDKLNSYIKSSKKVSAMQVYLPNNAGATTCVQ